MIICVSQVHVAPPTYVLLHQSLAFVKFSNIDSIV
jgi:hypothetical protein